MATQRHTGAKALAVAIVMGLTVVGCGALAAETGLGAPAAQQVVRDPQNPQWVGATMTAGEAATAQLHDPENPYWVGSSNAAYDNGIDGSRQTGPR
jgi:hypothetical protein